MSFEKNAASGPNVCPYLMVESVEVQIDFMVNVFNAEMGECVKGKDGLIQHGEVSIGDTTVMMGRASREYPARKAMNFVYVDNADETHRRALRHGAAEIMSPADRLYGIRESGFTDGQDNQWWVGHVIERSVKTEEVETLKNVELEWGRHIEENNVDEMAKYMNEDWVIFSGDGKMTTKAMFLKSVENGDLIHTRMDFKILVARRYGNVGIVVSQGTSAGTWKKHSFSNDEVATSVFIKTARKWRSILTMIAPAVKNS
jgi:uncharacterized glyoxalase superfamily protein PhnB